MQLMPAALLSIFLLAVALPRVNRAEAAAAAHDSQITILRSGSCHATKECGYRNGHYE